MSNIPKARECLKQATAACAPNVFVVIRQRYLAKADETDAMFMLGACAAFVSYLINKARFAGLI